MHVRMCVAYMSRNAVNGTMSFDTQELASMLLSWFRCRLVIRNCYFGAWLAAWDSGI